MTNFEKYKEKLFGILAFYIGVDKETGVPFLCNWVDKNVYCSGCDRCIFNGNCSCKMTTDWLNAECDEPPINNYDAKIRIDAIDEFRDKLKCLISMDDCIIDKVAEQLKEHKV